MAHWRKFSSTVKGDEPNSEPDVAGRFVLVVDLAQDAGHRHSHMSEIPLLLPASAHVASNSYASVTFSQAEGAHAECSKSPSDTLPDWCKYLAITVSQNTPSKCTRSSWPWAKPAVLFSAYTLRKNGRCSQNVKITGRRMPNNFDTHTTISKPEAMVQHGRSRGTIGKTLVRTSTSRIIVGTQTR